MKEANKRRLYADLLKYCEQLGVLPEDTPMLIIDRKEMHALRVLNGQPKRVAGYGQCQWDLRTIFVDVENINRKGIVGTTYSTGTSRLRKHSRIIYKPRHDRLDQKLIRYLLISRPYSLLVSAAIASLLFYVVLSK